MKAYRDKILSHKIQLWVRRGGPNYQEGLAAIREAGVALGIPTHVHGPETHMTAIVPMALMYVDPSFKYTSTAATGDGKASRPMICPRYGPPCAQDVYARTHRRWPPGARPAAVARGRLGRSVHQRDARARLRAAAPRRAGMRRMHRRPPRADAAAVMLYACLITRRTCSTLTTAASGPRPPSLA